MAEQCTVTVTYKLVALAQTWVVSLPREQYLWVPMSILTAPAVSLATAFFSPFILPYSHISTFSCIFSLSFPTQEPAQQPQVPINRGHAVHYFQRTWYPQLWTHRNSIQIIFLLTGKSCLAAVLVTDILCRFSCQPCLKHSLWTVIPTMNFLPWKARSGQ